MQNSFKFFPEKIFAALAEANPRAQGVVPERRLARLYVAGRRAPRDDVCTTPGRHKGP